MAEHDDAPTIWLIKLGRKGRYESVGLEYCVVALGFQPESEDMTGMSREQIAEMVDKKGGRRSTKIQLQMFKCDMEVGDGVVVPLHNSPGKMAVGRIVGDYKYESVSPEDEGSVHAAPQDGEPVHAPEVDSADSPVPVSAAFGEPVHGREVDWIVESMSKKSFGEHLKPYFDPRSTLRPIRHPEACDQIRLLLGGERAGDPQTAADAPEDDDLVSGVPLQLIAQEEIAERIHSRFRDAKLERLVAAVLEAEGYVAQQSEGGSDQGADVLAGYGAMGFDSPRICVQVKHTNSPTSAPDVQNLRGAMLDFKAEQGLFVSWSDYTSAARNEARRNFFTLRLWNANDVIEAVCRNYDKLPSDIRAEIPLKQVWTLVQDDDL